MSDESRNQGSVPNAILTIGSGTGAAALVYVLANAWVASVQEDARIAIEQAHTQGLSIDSIRNELASVSRELSELRAFRRAGPRFTLDQGEALERRVERLEAYLLRPDARSGVDEGKAARVSEGTLSSGHRVLVHAPDSDHPRVSD